MTATQERQTFPRDEREFSVSYMGRCPAKGCKVAMRIACRFKSWTETHHDHAVGYSYPARKSRALEEPWRSGIHCVKHRREMSSWTQINGHVSPNVKCDVRCTNAIGPNCDCSCGGKNHGCGHGAGNLISI